MCLVSLASVTRSRYHNALRVRPNSRYFPLSIDSVVSVYASFLTPVRQDHGVVQGTPYDINARFISKLSWCDARIAIIKLTIEDL